MNDPQVIGRPAVAEVLDRLASTATDRRLAARLRGLVEDLSQQELGGPFLSVLLRTQGKRLEAFRDALLCLAGQSDDDFEVIVIEHDVAEEDAAAVRATIDEQPAFLADRITVVQTIGGTRAKPLNAGVAAARGRYIAVYDDDDLLFANWVEAFRAGAERSPGRLMRAVVANQSASPEQWAWGKEGFRTLSWPRAEFALSFDQIEHLQVNHSPFMTLAFPRVLFTRFGLKFDETLVVCEDWDLILRGGLLLGVDDVPFLTAIYRRWSGAESSYTVHDEEEWAESEQQVIDRLNQSYLLLGPGSMTTIRKLLAIRDSHSQLDFLFSGRHLIWPLRLLLFFARPAVRVYIRWRRRWRAVRRSGLRGMLRRRKRSKGQR